MFILIGIVIFTFQYVLHVLVMQKTNYYYYYLQNETKT